MKSELLFKNLFAITQKEWPEEIIFGKLIHYDTPDGGTGYSIENMLSFPKKIERKYAKHPNKILIMYLHRHIYKILGYSARDYLKIKIENLRPETIKKEFEDVLKSELADSELLNWTPEDVQLVKDYFAVNYPESLKK